jgi:hypothetical protein
VLVVVFFFSSFPMIFIGSSTRLHLTTLSVTTFLLSPSSPMKLSLFQFHHVAAYTAFPSLLLGQLIFTMEQFDPAPPPVEGKQSSFDDLLDSDGILYFGIFFYCWIFTVHVARWLSVQTDRTRRQQAIVLLQSQGIEVRFPVLLLLFRFFFFLKYEVSHITSFLHFFFDAPTVEITSTTTSDPKRGSSTSSCSCGSSGGSSGGSSSCWSNGARRTRTCATSQ